MVGVVLTENGGLDLEMVCSVLDVPEGRMKGFTVGSKYVLIANVDGNFYAVDAVCPHRGGYLPVGTLEKKILTCPVHGAQYDVTNGKLLKDVSQEVIDITGSGASDLETYKVLIMENSVYIRD
jgi:nitrite reductase/ring-hydroxylating ferredoxin subunit